MKFKIEWGMVVSSLVLHNKLSLLGCLAVWSNFALFKDTTNSNLLLSDCEEKPLLSIETVT